MSNIENDIRRVMAAHDGEAPRAADLLSALAQASGPRRRRASWYVPFAVAAAVVAVLVGGAWAGGLLGGRQQPPAAAPGGAGRVARLSCPARYARQAPWVPAGPAGVDGRSRLVPQRTPSSALVCAYSGWTAPSPQAGWALSGQRLLAGNLAGLASQLTWQPRTGLWDNTQMAGQQTNYLIGLSYPGGGRIWVAATDEPNESVSSSNGEFTSTGVIGPAVTRAFTSGRWPVPPGVSCAAPGAYVYQDLGRLGQETAMVPAGATSVTICAPHAHTLTSGYQSLVSALNRLPARPGGTGAYCSPAPEPSAEYQLLFSYPEGPPVSVSILIGCHPEIFNSALQTASASSILPVIQQLLTPK